MRQNKRKCWAACLGDCKGPLTLEHIASASIFHGDMITSEGMRWNDGPVTQNKSKWGSHILCKHHNETTSPLDACAGQLTTAIRRFWRLKKNETLTVDGRLLERWSVKLAINMLACGWFLPRKLTPPRSLVEIVFGLRDFSVQAGLHNILMVQHRCVTNNLQFMPLGTMHPNKFSLHGIVFNLESVVFGLFPRDGNHSAYLTKLGIRNGFDLTEAKAIRRPRELKLERRSPRTPKRVQTLHVVLDWGEMPTPF